MKTDVRTKALAGTRRSHTVSFNDIFCAISPYLNRVEEKLNKIANDSDGRLKESSRYLLLGGGKRLRASLVLFCASIRSRADGKRNGNSLRPLFDENIMRSAVEIAAAVELIHSATLVHDDIIDRASLRRLRPAVHTQFGEDVAILLGDFLYAKTFGMIARAGDKKIVELLAETAQEMCEGEINQLEQRLRPDLALNEYLSFIKRKTASLISICTTCGARLARLSPGETRSLAGFGMNIGIAYQMVDDLLDIVGSESKTGKTLHTDAGNGKMTLPLILLAEKLAGKEKGNFNRRLQSLNLDKQWLMPSIKKYKIAEQTKEFAGHYSRRAIQAIEKFNPAFREPMEKLSHFILNRDY